MSFSSGAGVSLERDSSVHGKYYLEHILERCSDAQTASQTKLEEGGMGRSNNMDSGTCGPTRRQAVFGFAVVLGGLAMGSTNSWSTAEDGISHSAEAIHQEPTFTACPKRIYEALIDTKLFDRITQLSGAMESMHLGDIPTAISPEVGGGFTLFGGHITGRNVELVPNQRIVQAWRAGNWDAGTYSIARFELVAQGSGTKIVFDHTGFPNGDAKSLASGWKAHYWEPLGKLVD
jgi:activator of HSP90 ATPase